mgnify:CR=1 FL=1
MPTKVELETRIYEKMSQENSALLTEMINAAMEELAKPERSVERKTVKKDAPER